MESTAAHIQQLKTQWEDLYDSLVDTDSVNDITDSITFLLDKTTNFIDSIGGGEGVLLGFGAVATQVFNKQIAQGLENIATKFSNTKSNIAQINAELSNTKIFAQNLGLNPKLTNQIVALKQSIQEYYDVMTQEEIQQANSWVQQAADIGLVKEQLEQSVEVAKQFTTEIAKVQGGRSGRENTGEASKRANKIQQMTLPTLDTKTLGGHVLNDEYETFFKNLEKINGAYDSLQTNIEKYTKMVRDNSTSQQDQSKQLDKVNKQYQELEKLLPTLKAYAQASGNPELISQYTALENTLGQLQTAYQKYNQIQNATTPSDKAKYTKDVNSNLTQEKNIINSLIPELKDYASTQKEAFTDEGKAKIEGANQALRDQAAAIKEATTAFDTRQFISGLTSIASGLSTVGFAYSSLTSIIKTWDDESTSTLDKLAQTFISLTMIIPAVTTVVSGLNNAKTIANVLTGKQIVLNGQLYASQSALNAIQSISNATLEASIVELNAQGYAFEEVALQSSIANGTIDKNTLALILNTQAARGDAVAQNALGQSMGSVGSGTQGLIKNLPKLGDKFKSIGTSIKTAGQNAVTFTQGLTGVASQGAAIGILAGTFIFVAAAVTTAVIAYQKWKASLEETAKKSQAAADEAKKQTEEIKKQKEAVDELTDSYKELKEQYSDPSDIHQLRTEVYELCKQYNLQDLAIKTLTASYDELNEIMADAQATANKTLGDALDTEKTSITKAFETNVWKDLSHSERDSLGVIGNRQQTIDLKGFNGILNTQEGDLKEALERLGAEFIDNHLTLESFSKMATNNYEELVSILNGSGTEAATQLSEILEKQSDNLNRYQTLLEQQKTQIADTYLPVTENIDSTKEYEKLKEQLLNDEQLKQLFTNSAGELDEEGLETWVNEWMSSIDSIKEYALNADLATILTPKFGGLNKDEIERQLDNLDNITKNFIQDHIDLVPAYNSVADFVEHFQDIIEGLQQQEINLKINAVFQSEKSGAYGEEEIADLYNNTNFEEKSGISQESFTAMSFAEQQQALLDYYTVANEQENQYRKNVKQTTQDKIDEIDTQIGKLQELREKYSEQDLESATGGYLDNTISQLTELDKVNKQVFDSQVELTKVIQNFSEGAIDGSDERIQYLQEILGLSEDQIKRLGELISVQEDYNKVASSFNKEGKSYKNLLTDLGDRQSDLSKIQEEASESTTEWAEAFEEQKERMSNVSSEIDDIQSAYKSLTSIMEDYNETGVLTMDNLQSILSMDTEYLAALQIENGQMSLNEEVLKQLALTKLDEAEATAYEEAMTELHTIAENKNADASNNVTTATQSTTVALNECKTALEEGAVAWDNYWAKMTQGAGATTSAETQAVGQALQTKLTAIQSVRDQITSGNFSTTMNGTSSSSSGSSGSSSSSESKPDEEDKLKISDIDIYKGINEELDKIESVLGRIQTIDDHSWGKSAIDALTKESKILETQLKTYKEKAEMQEGDLANQRASLEEQGITFSNDGSTMTNASEKLKALYEEYNAMVDTYNAMSKTEQDEYKDTLEKKKDAIDDLEDAIDDYESLYSSYQDTLDSILEKQYEIIEKNVEAFNAEVEVHLELDEAKTAWNDFWYDVVKDVGDLDFGDRIAKSLDNLKVLVGYGSKKTSNSKVSELTSHLTDTTSEVWKQINNAENGGAGLFGSDTAKSKETLTDYRDKLISAVTEAKEAVDDIAQTYLDMLDDAQDKIDKQVKGWEAIEDHINHNVSLIKLISGEKAYDSLVKQYDSLYKNDINLINTQKQSKEFWAGEIKRYESLLANTEKGTKQWKTYTKALETATDNYRDSIKNLDSALESAIQNVQSWRENQVNATFDKLDKAMSGGLGLDLVEEEWNLINNNASKYLDNVERAYSIEEYTLDLDEAANAIGLSAENQAKLNAFRDEELTKLREKNKLTQYDIDESRARLEIMRQEMALEEQKNNKSNMRLRRDSQGNYTYQYTGNDEDIEETEKAGLTARKEWYQLVKNRYTELSKDVIDIYKEQTTLLKEIDDAKLAGDTERENKLLEMYNQNEQYLVQIHEEAEKNKQDLASGTAQYFAEVENAQVLPQSAATVRTLIDQWAGSGKNSFLGAATNAINELDSTQTEYVNRTNKLLQEAGVDYKDLKEKGIDPTTDSLNDLVDSNEDFAEKLEAVNEQLTTQEENLKAAEEAYNNLKTAAADAIEKANECLEKLSETSVKVKETVETNIQAVKNAASEAASAINSLSNSGSSGSSDSGSSNGGNSSSSQKTYRLQSGLSYSGLFKIVDSDNNVVDENTIPELRKKWKGKVTGLKTGGYTGDWSDDSGKLAVLHKKELVLNESDTSNMLKAVDAVRDLVSNNSSADISGIAESLVRAGAMQAQMLAQVGSGLLATMSSIVNNATSQNYSNNMTVNADFSGVRSADAIYQALRELENYGSQVAYSDAPISNKAY